MNKKAKKSKNKQSLNVNTGVKGSLILLFIALLTAAAGVWFLWTGPARADLTSTQESLMSVTEDNNRIRAKITNLQTGGASEGEDKYAEALRLDRYLPTDIDKVQLAARIPALAKQHNVTVTELTPEDSANSGSSVTTLSFRTGVEGAANDVLAFLTAVTSDSNNIGLLTISNVTTSSNADKFVASFVLHAHAAKEPPLSAKAPDAPVVPEDPTPEPQAPVAPPEQGDKIDVFGEIEELDFDE